MARQRIQEQERVANRRRDFYTYEAEVRSLAAGASANDIINIEADSNFIMQKLTTFSTIGAFPGGVTTEATRDIPQVTIQLNDTGSGRNLNSNPVPIDNIFGTGQRPFILPNPRVFLRNSTIQVSFTNFSAATIYNIILTFIGYKLYVTA